MPGGEEVEVRPANGKAFTLEELQKLVSGSIELVHAIVEGRRRNMYVNECCAIDGMAFNQKATAYYFKDAGNVICGPAVVMDVGEG